MTAMHETNIRALDLNLLVVLEQLLKQSTVSAAADETLRFWSIFGGGPTSPSRRKGQMRELGMSSIGGGMSIR